MANDTLVRDSSTDSIVARKVSKLESTLDTLNAQLAAKGMPKISMPSNALVPDELVQALASKIGVAESLVQLLDAEAQKAGQTNGAANNTLETLSVVANDPYQAAAAVQLLDKAAEGAVALNAGMQQRQDYAMMLEALAARAQRGALGEGGVLGVVSVKRVNGVDILTKERGEGTPVEIRLQAERKAQEHERALLKAVAGTRFSTKEEAEVARRMLTEVLGEKLFEGYGITVQEGRGGWGINATALEAREQAQQREQQATQQTGRAQPAAPQTPAPARAASQPTAQQGSAVPKPKAPAPAAAAQSKGWFSNLFGITDAKTTADAGKSPDQLQKERAAAMQASIAARREQGSANIVENNAKAAEATAKYGTKMTAPGVTPGRGGRSSAKGPQL